MLANDLLLFCKTDKGSVELLWKAFSCFFESSELTGNPHKSNVYFSGINDHLKLEILEFLIMSEGEFTFRYLSVPLHSKKLNDLECGKIVDKLTVRLAWFSKLLTHVSIV